jgi:hypothetical protein
MPVFISPRNRVVQLNPQALSSLVRVIVTLRLAIYRQSVRLGAEPLENHSQNFFSSTEHLPVSTRTPYVASTRTT